MPVINKDDLFGAKLDADDLRDFVSANPALISPRFGADYPNVRLLIEKVLNGEIAGEGLANIVEPYVDRAEDAVDAAIAAASTAESVAGPTYASVAAGEAATTAGQSFAVDNGDGTVTVYLRTSGGSAAQRTLATTAALFSTDPEKGTSLVRKGYAVLRDILNVTPEELKFPGDIGDGPSIVRAAQYCLDHGKTLKFMPRMYFYSGDIHTYCEVFGEGVDSSWLVKTGPGTIYHYKGAFKGVKIAPLGAAILPGDTTRGFVATGLDRKDILVRTEYHGGDGFVFESGNLTRAKVYSRRNGGRGLYLPTHVTGDNNCLKLWCEASRNGLAGFEIQTGPDTNMANCIVGEITSQANGVNAAPGSDFDVILAGFEHDITVYAERATGSNPTFENSVHLTSSLKSALWIGLQVADYTTILDETTDDSNEISYTHGARGNRRTKSKRVENLVIKKQAFVGNLRITQTADRTYVVAAEGSGSEQTISLLGNLTFRNKNNKPFVTQIFKGATLNFGTIAAGASATQTITFDTAPLADSVVTAMPRTPLGAGVSFYVYVDDASPTVARIVMTNHTASSFTDSNRAWRAQALSL